MRGRSTQKNNDVSVYVMCDPEGGVYYFPDGSFFVVRSHREDPEKMLEVAVAYHAARGRNAVVSGLKRGRLVMLPGTVPENTKVYAHNSKAGVS